MDRSDAAICRSVLVAAERFDVPLVVVVAVLGYAEAIAIALAEAVPCIAIRVDRLRAKIRAALPERHSATGDRFTRRRVAKNERDDIMAAIRLLVDR